MKRLFFFLFTLGFGGTTKAQSPIVDYNSINIPDYDYCKDLDNDLDTFAGTWKFTDGSSEFLLKIVKQEQVFKGRPVNYYTDQLSGNYRYIKNETIVVNTLNNDFESNSMIVGYKMALDKKKFMLVFFDPGKARAEYSLELEYMGTDLLGNEKIKWTLQQTGLYSGDVPGETPPT
jgi:hypothetical protein